MLRNDHRIVALATSTLIITPIHPDIETFLGSQLVAFAMATLPDIDEKLSWLKHRGITHTIWSWLAITTFWWITTENHILTMAASIGYLSHLIVDSLSIAGIRWFKPFSNNSKDSKYGIFVGYSTNGTVLHHHFGYIGYHVGGRLETVITIIAGLIYFVLLTQTLQTLI